jgi:hypothetical protein
VAISNGYATLAQVKAAARITDNVDDSLLEMCTETASRMVDGYCERRFYTAGTETRFFAADTSYVCSIDDVIGTAITVKTSSDVDGIYDLTWTASDYQLEPGNRTASGLAFPTMTLRAVGDYLFPIVGNEVAVEVTGVFGFGTAVPTQVTHATILLALRQYKRYDSPTGVLGFGDMGAVRVGSRLDPDVAMILAPLRRTPVGVA